ncbi:PAXIP1-associated glutamate-rich protein 1 [Euwallacea similis]|uniref:PAXIP1-associated glutamate-rich protein 1 n=1 Tax=Euwallacea similis TaxID=1736056 RepID=UPI00344D058A
MAAIGTEESFCIECSDDELKDSGDPWEPDLEEIYRIYSLLSKGEIPQLKWSCPGYRTPSPEPSEEPKEENTEMNTDEQDDFDFMDETSSPRLKIRHNKTGDTLKGSAKKKTTSLDGVINNMRRHHLLPSAK